MITTEIKKAKENNYEKIELLKKQIKNLEVDTVEKDEELEFITKQILKIRRLENELNKAKILLNKVTKKYR